MQTKIKAQIFYPPPYKIYLILSLFQKFYTLCDIFGFCVIISPMSKKDRTKFSLNFAKGLVFALLTALFGIFAFVVIHIEELTRFQMIASVIGIVIIAVFFYFLIKFIAKELKKLEKMK